MRVFNSQRLFITHQTYKEVNGECRQPPETAFISSTWPSYPFPFPFTTSERRVHIHDSKTQTAPESKGTWYLDG